MESIRRNYPNSRRLTGPLPPAGGTKKKLRSVEREREQGEDNLFRLYLISSLASRRRDLLSFFNPDSRSRER